MTRSVPRTWWSGPRPSKAKPRHDFTARQRGLDLEHGINLAQADDLHLQSRIDGFEHRAGFPGVLLVHHHVDLEPVRPPGGPYDLETAEVGAEQHAPVPRCKQLFNILGAMDLDIEPGELLLEEVKPVEYGGCKGVVVAESVRYARFAPQHPAQVLPRCGPWPGRERQEVEADRIQQQSRGRPSEGHRHPDNDSQCEHVAAFRPVDPLRRLRAVYVAVDRALHDTWPVNTGLPSTAHANLTSPLVVRENSIETRSPGRVGCRNLAEVI